MSTCLFGPAFSSCSSHLDVYDILGERRDGLVHFFQFLLQLNFLGLETLGSQADWQLRVDRIQFSFVLDQFLECRDPLGFRKLSRARWPQLRQSLLFFLLCEKLGFLFVFVDVFRRFAIIWCARREHLSVHTGEILFAAHLNRGLFARVKYAHLLVNLRCLVQPIELFKGIPVEISLLPLCRSILLIRARARAPPVLWLLGLVGEGSKALTSSSKGNVLCWTVGCAWPRTSRSAAEAHLPPRCMRSHLVPHGELVDILFYAALHLGELLHFEDVSVRP